MPLATGQITIVDLTDLPSLQGYLTCNQPKIQFQNANDVYNPSWASSPYLKIDAELYAVGSGTNIASDAKVTAITWYKNGVEITANGGGITRNASATGNLLNTSITINQNLLTTVAPTLKIDCVMMYKHASTVDATPVKVSLEFALARQGEKGLTGLGGLTAILSNESCALPVSTGGIITYTGTPTLISVYEGSTQLDYDGLGTAAGKWKVTAAATGITAGLITESLLNASVDAASLITADTAKVVYTITGKRGDGTAFTLTKEQSFTKSAAGLNATSIDLSGPQVFKYDSTGGSVTPSSITITSTRKNISSTTYTWTYGLDGAAPTTALNTTNFPGVTFGTDTATITAASTGWNSAKSMTIKADNGGNIDTFTIYKVQDGAHSYLVTLEATSNIFTFNYLGAATPANQEITLTAVLNNLSSPSFAGTWYNAAGIGTPVTAGDIVGTGNTRTFNVSKWPASAVSIKFTVTAGAYSDSLTVIKVQESASALSGYLTNESITLACDKDGVVTGTIGTLTAGTFKAFYGTTALVTPAVTFAEEGTEVGCTASINNTTGAYSLSDISADTATVTFRATHVASGAYILKTLTVSKSKVGATGIQGPGAINLEVWTPTGSVFKNIGGAAPANLTIQADLYQGPTSVSATSYTWYIQTGTASDNGAGPGWDVIDATTGCTGYTTKTISVPAASVTSFENFKCKAVYGGVSYWGSASLTDMTDPYTVEIVCPEGTVFFNGGGTNKSLTAKVYQGGQVVDAAGTALAYSWTKWVGGAMVGAAGSAGTTKTISVPASAVDTEASYTCDVSYL